MSIGTSYEQQERPTLLRFYHEPQEDREETIKQGRVVYKDIEMVDVTPTGGNGNLIVPKIVEIWIETLEMNNDPFTELYMKQYNAWKKNEEIPEEGTPIKHWGNVTEAQKKNILSASIRTVEDLAAANEGALSKIGTGARSLQEKARAYLLASESSGKIVEENSALKANVEDMKKEIERLREILEKDAKPAPKKKATKTTKPSFEIE